MDVPSPASLEYLRSLRTAPQLSPDQATALAVELATAMGRCCWFTVGVMAPRPAAAIAALRALEQHCGWPPLEPDPIALAVPLDQPVFLKGNQQTGRFAMRAEQGLGSGILLTGHNPDDLAAEATWGPLPLDFFG